MKKKPQGNEIIITIITVMIAIFVVIMTIFFNKYQDAKEDKDRYQRIVEIYKKADDNNGETKKKYVKRLNEAEEELRKVKKETNYKGYNEKSNKERQKEDKKTRDKIYDVTGDDDLILVKNNIEFSDKVDNPEILISEDGVGTITVPTDSGYEKQTVGSIITSVLGSPYLSQNSPSTDSLGIIDSNVYPNTANSVPMDNPIITNPVNPTAPSDILPPTDNPVVDNVPTDNPVITNPVEPDTPSDILPPTDNPSVPILPGNTEDNNAGNIDNPNNPNPPPPGYTDEDGGRGSGGGGNVEPPPTEEPSDNGDTGDNEEEEVTPEPEPEPEQPNEKPDEGNDNEEEPSEPSENPDENEAEETEPSEPETPSEPDDKADEEDTNEGTSEDGQTTEQPEEQPDDNTTDNEDKIEEE
ncbi:hypothetical protein vBSauClo6_5 [Staphylococcus phage vB_Sau_Clo6]|nr:hypothetical protein vBSauClo6_5 [Staphylococcus phage vB_Sau_Clo6]